MESRVANSKKNIKAGLITKILILGIAFFLRTTFIKVLGEEYTGVNSLYSNILSILSLAELGIGSISSFYLYSALEDNDCKKIRYIVEYFKKIYWVIMVVIMILGLLLIPLLFFVVKSNLDNNKLILYYIIFLLNSVASYIYEYRIQIISADQKNYIISLVSAISTIAMYIAQFVILIITHNYILYLLVQLIVTVVNKLVLNKIVSLKYSFLNDQNLLKGTNFFLDTNKIKKEMSISFFSKVSSVLVDQTDSILISMLFSTTLVGYYSNYMLIMTYVTNFIGISYGAITASYGNLVASGNKKRISQMFFFTNFAFWVLATAISVTYFCIIQDFIPIWIGDRFKLEQAVALAISLSCCINIVYKPVALYRNVMGLFTEGIKSRLLVVVLNIFLSVMLGKLLGVEGVIIATPISKVLTIFIIDTQIVCDKLEAKKSEVIKSLLLYVLQFILIFFAAYILTSKICIKGYIGIFIKLVVCIIVILIVVYIFNKDSDEYKYMRDIFLNRKNIRG